MSEAWLWSDERMKARANELDGELFSDNTRPWQHYMEVWRTLSYEMRDEYEARITELEAQLAEAGQWVPVTEGLHEQSMTNYSNCRSYTFTLRTLVRGGDIIQWINDERPEAQDIMLPDGWKLMRQRPTEEATS